MNNCIIYVNNMGDVPIYQQFNGLANYAKNKSLRITDRVLDFDGKNFHTAVNKIIANNDITTLLIFDEDVFEDFEEYIFYRVYLQKMNKKLIICN